ncbi:hypothetical protein [Thioalbus denitrificans]|nr:hypothetical protein [Thioalbus denitrificans]
MNPRRGVACWALMLALAGCVDDSDSGKGATAGSAPDRIDLCTIVTQADASALFGNPARPQAGTPVLDQNMLGECLWTWDSGSSNQLLQARVWSGARYYRAPADARSLGFVDRGFIQVHPLGGVDVEWVQTGRTVSLSYSSVGPDVPGAANRTEAVEALARKLKDRL